MLVSEANMAYQGSKDTNDNLDTSSYERDLASDLATDLARNSEQSLKDMRVRKRIDELLERKRLKALFDDSEDWDI